MIVMRQTICFFVNLLIVACFTSCGGVSGDNGDDPFGTGTEEVVSKLQLQILDQQCIDTKTQSFTAGETICLQATLTQDNSIVSGEIINFETGLGELSVSTKLTDAQGNALITLLSDSGDVGASSIRASFGDTVVEVNFEFLRSDVEVDSQPSIAILMLSNGLPVNRFQTDETVQLQAVLLDDSDNAIENEIVLFSAGKGNLNTSEALTNKMGIAQVTLSALETDLGALVVSAQTQINDVQILDAINVEIQSADIVDAQVISLGSFTQDNIFVAGEIGASSQDSSGHVQVSAGGTFGLSVGIVDQNGQRILTQTHITFTSSCVTDGKASLDAQVNTINGIAQATFEDISCAGSTGINDIIVASSTINNTTVSISREFSILAEDIGAVQFISATPQNIVLQGTGGQNNESVSTLVFQVTGEVGNPLARQEVDFSLNTQTGGLTLSPLVGVTNSQGQVSTRVNAGNVPTSVRVTAKVNTADGAVISSQSNLLSVSTGLPDQNSFTLSASDLNPEADGISGQTVNLIARLADTFNNPVPDGTSVNFTTEGGSITSSCVTLNGNCGVEWTSANPRTADHRVTILATAIGHETLFDENGNNSYEDSDGGPILDNTDSGFSVSAYGVTGFVDHSEAWRDDNEDNIRNAAEIFLDFNYDGVFNGPDSVFNGPQCIPGNACGDEALTSLHVRKALVLVMSGSSALMDIVDTSNNVNFSNYQTASQPSLSIASGSSLSFRLWFSDTAVQPIASGSTIVISSSAGSLAGQINTVMPSTNRAGARETSFTLTNDVDTPVDATITAAITSPSGVASTVVFQVALN
jgi:hypothetical protein